MTPWKRRLVAQFGGPSGVLGGVAGWIMAYRHGNRRRNRWAISLLGIEAADRILEIGFGPGLALADACRQAPEGEVVGLDHSETMFRQASRRLRKEIRAGRVDLRLADVATLDDSQRPFDRILTVNAFQFWGEPLDRLRTMRRLLRPSGRIAIAFQPPWRGATNRDAQLAGEKLEAPSTMVGVSSLAAKQISSPVWSSSGPG